jgi:hypothetical protein
MEEIKTASRASKLSDSHVRRQITGISFLCALHYLNLFRNFPIPDGRSLRRASGLVLVGDQGVIKMGSWDQYWEVGLSEVC